MAAREIRKQIMRDVTQETVRRLREQRIDEDPSALINRLADPVERLIRADRWDEIRNVIESGLRSEIGTYDRTMALTDLARRWKNTEEFFDSSNESLFGSTPMRECLERIAERFRRESAGLPPGLPKILILVTDGQPTDGDIGPAVWKLKSFGVRIVSCFVADSDLVMLRRLYATPQPHWTGPARLMFESASVIDDDRLFGELLQAQGWEIDQGARFFIQANHSELLEEFFSSAFERGQEARHEPPD